MSYLCRRGSRIFCRGVNDGRVQRAPSVPTGGLGLINIRLRYIASIKYSFFNAIFFSFAIVKKFVEKKNWWSRAGGVTTPTPPPTPPPRIRACYVQLQPLSIEPYSLTTFLSLAY